MIDFNFDLQELIKNNQFAQGGLLIGIVGGVIAYLKNVPNKIYDFLEERLVFTVTFSSIDPMFVWFIEYINKHPQTQKKNYLALHTQVDRDEDEVPRVVGDDAPISKIAVHYSIGRGSFYFKIDGYWIKIVRAKEENNSLRLQEKNMGMMLMPENISLRTFIWNRKKIRKSLQAIYEKYTEENKNTIQNSMWSWQQWVKNFNFKKKRIENIILKQGQLEDIINDIAEFKKPETRKFYEDKNIPYQRGYLFYGPPGTGKTTLAATLASHFNMETRSINFRKCDGDYSLKSAFDSTSRSGIIIIEDFDSFFNKREVVDSKLDVSFSGLLNAINGIGDPDGRILVITTNKIETLDEALIRPGRIDKMYELGYVDADQANRIFYKFFNEYRDFSFIEGKNVSPARIQDICISNIGNPEKAFQVIKETNK